MVAFVIMASTAVAVYPVFTEVKRHSKTGDLRQLCENVVRGKLEEYRSGRLTKVSDASGSGGTTAGDYAGMANAPQLDLLSMPTLSATSIGGVVGGTGTSVSGGFLYAKVRYNRYFPQNCNGKSNAKIFTQASYTANHTSPPVLGMRECVGNNTILSISGDPVNLYDPPGPPTGCGSPADQLVSTEMPGFKLYVNLSLATGWPVPQGNPGNSTGDVNKDAEFGAGATACPDFGSAAPATPFRSASLPAPLYDFDGAGDGIQVTVTGVIDALSINPGAQYVGEVPVQDTNRLMCSVTATVRPEAYPVRYFISHDGRIFSVHGHGLNGLDNGVEKASWVLPSLYVQGGGGATPMMASGITSIAVHPRDLSVYVLRPGSLMRYSNCGGVPLDCNPTVTTPGGVSDLGVTPWPTVQEWILPPSIRFVAVDFRNSRVYGMSGDRTQIYEIWADNAKNPIAKCSGCGLASQPYMETVTAAGFTLPPAGTNWPFRLTGFFISGEGDEGFVSDMTTQMNMRGATYSASVYRITDTTLAYPIVTFPVGAVSFSP